MSVQNRFSPSEWNVLAWLRASLLSLTLLALTLLSGCRSQTVADEVFQRPRREVAIERLLAAYPGIITKIEGNDVVFSDGGQLPFDDGKVLKSLEDWLENPDIEDMMAQPYPAGLTSPPSKDHDPGRARNEKFFAKVYGDCLKHQVEPKLVNVLWLPKKYGHKIKFTKVNGAAKHLQAVSEELDTLPAKFNVDLFPTAGTYNCRKVAGTKHMSSHGHGIAIDIALKHAHYWRWFEKPPGPNIPYKNKIPFEIVRIFEKHGFIWGGKWHHYDTMHFEYRPELLMPEAE